MPYCRRQDAFLLLALALEGRARAAAWWQWFELLHPARGGCEGRPGPGHLFASLQQGRAQALAHSTVALAHAHGCAFPSHSRLFDVSTLPRTGALGKLRDTPDWRERNLRLLGFSTTSMVLVEGRDEDQTSPSAAGKARDGGVPRRMLRGSSWSGHKEMPNAQAEVLDRGVEPVD